MMSEDEKDRAAADLVACAVAPFLFAGFGWGLVRFPAWLLGVDVESGVGRAALIGFTIWGLVTGLVGAWNHLDKERF